MKKTFLLVLFSNIIFAQAKLEDNKFQINAGSGQSYWGTPIYLGVDYGIGNYSIGAEIFNRKKEDKKNSSSIDKYDFYGINVDINYHFLKNSEKVDFYGGSSFNYYTWEKETIVPIYEGLLDEKKKVNGFGNGVQIGTRFFFTPKIALQIEGKFVVIYGEIFDPTLKAGITYKL